MDSPIPTTSKVNKRTSIGEIGFPHSKNNKFTFIYVHLIFVKDLSTVDSPRDSQSPIEVTTLFVTMDDKIVMQGLYKLEYNVQILILYT